MRDRKPTTVNESAVRSYLGLALSKSKRGFGELSTLSMIVLSEATAGEGRKEKEAPLTRYRTLPRTAADYYCHQT